MKIKLFLKNKFKIQILGIFVGVLILQSKIKNVSFDRQKFIETTASYVDGYIEYHGKKIIIQVDGPHHYYMGELCSADVFMDLLLEREAYTVIRINASASVQEKDRIIENILNLLKTEQPSV